MDLKKKKKKFKEWLKKRRKRMNECLTTPQHEKQIGYWVSQTNDKLKPKIHITKYVKIHNIIKYSVKSCTL